MMYWLKIIWEIFKVGLLFALLIHLIVDPTGFTAASFWGWSITCTLWDIKDYLKEKLG